MDDIVIIRFRAKFRLQNALEKYAEQNETTVSQALRKMAKKLVGMK